MTHTFESHVERGNREFDVEAAYEITGGRAVLTKWCIVGGDYPLTSRELEQLDEEADAHCAEVLAESAEAEPALEVIEALRDAISFIQSQERGWLNRGSDEDHKRAEACRLEAARLYPVYARLTGCEMSAELADECVVEPVMQQGERRAA